MRHFVLLTLHVQIYFCIFTIQTDANTIHGLLPDVSILRRFLELIMQPQATMYQHNSKPTIISRRFYIEAQIKKAIEDKIKEFEPYLQDNDDNHDSKDKLTLQGNDETTIVEYVPKSHKGNITENDEKLVKFKENIEKYKKMRRKIEKLLDKEIVSDDTKVLVTKTLDDMIANLIENQCKWRKVDLGKELFPNHKSDFTAREFNSKEWLEVKKHYTNLLENKNIRDSLSFLHQSFDFFSKISNYFNVQCRFVDQEPDVLTRSLGQTNHNCDNFKICSSELRRFLGRFYKSLNTTAVSTFSNYAEMYLRDVNTEDSQEKDHVITLIKNISHIIEHRVNKIFRKVIVSLKLDTKKNKEANIKALSQFVTDTGSYVLKHVQKHLDNDLNSLNGNKMFSVKQDLTVNLNMDIGSLEKKYIDKICKVFSVCNNNYVLNRNNTRRTLELSDKNIYVKVQLSLDDDLKNELASRVSEMRENVEKGRLTGHNCNVTRTTQNDALNTTPKVKFPVVKSNSMWKKFLNGAINDNKI